MLIFKLRNICTLKAFCIYVEQKFSERVHKLRGDLKAFTDFLIKGHL